MLKNKNKKIKKIVVHLISKWLGSQKIIIIMIVCMMNAIFDFTLDKNKVL